MYFVLQRLINSNNRALKGLCSCRNHGACGIVHGVFATSKRRKGGGGDFFNKGGSPQGVILERAITVI